ncbi:MAG: protein translocase subunit SecF [bacterium]
MSTTILGNKNIVNVIKYRWIWIAISLILIVPGILAMIYSVATYPTHSPFKLGIDFTGGTIIQYGFNKELTNSDIAIIREDFKSVGIENSIIQPQKVSSFLKNSSNNKDFSQINSIISIRTRFLDSEKSNNEINKVNQKLKASFGDFTLLQVSSIGPTLGKELFKNAIIALLLAFAAIVGYLTFRFKLDYAVFALIALFHDAFFVCGVFSILGLVFKTEIDSLFITAILTVVGFSVHDTIVVFDRIRENSRFLAKKVTFNEIVNASVNQTLARSINTSLTALITLLALFFLGGATTKDFVLSMTLGIFIGTYSSIFNASTLLAMWRSKNIDKKVQKSFA